MKYKIDSILEVASFVQKLNSEQRKLFLNQFSNSISTSHTLILNELESMDLRNEVIHSKFLDRTDVSKSYNRFKKKLEEFRLAEESIGFLEKKDVHVSKQIHIHKQFLSTQVEFEHGLTHNTLDNLQILFKKAQSLETLELQKNIAERIKRIFQKMGNQKEYLKWKVQVFEVRSKIEVFSKIAHRFNELTLQTLCCDHHTIKIERDDLFSYQMAFKRTKMLKVRWMKGFLRAMMFRCQKDHKNAQRIAWKLLSVYKENQVVLSRHYYLVLMQFILENMYYLRKEHIIQSGRRRIHVLDSYPLYQIFPFLAMNLYSYFRNRQWEKMKIEITRIQHVYPVGSYFHINQHLHLADIHSLFLSGDCHGCLQMINRGYMLNGLKCCVQNADLRTLEIMCFIDMHDMESAADKIESFRKYLERKGSDHVFVYMEIVKNFKILLKKIALNQDFIGKLKPIESEIPIYSYQPFGFNMWIAKYLS